MFPGHRHTCIRRGDLDDAWLPIVGEAALLLITRDRRIRYRLIEKRLLRDYSVKGLFLTQAGHMNMWEILKMVMRNWEQIDALAGVPGPWAKSLTRVGINDLKLPD